jgi:5-methylcytosine-specific restriction endonuclease McrA
MSESTFTMREPCRRCDCSAGYIETRNGQDCVFCSACGKHSYNAPKTETGREARSVSSVHNGIKPKQRSRIIERATGRCELCGAKGNLHVGHLVSVVYGVAKGLTDSEINSDENLAAMCDECNLGIGANPVPLRLAVAMVMARTRNTDGAE